MTPTLTLSGGFDDWRVWLGDEVVASFPSLNDAWNAIKAAHDAVKFLETGHE